MSRTVDLSSRLSEEDREYLLARGREQDVLNNDARFTDDAEAARFAAYVPGTSVDRADGVPHTVGGDPRVVMGGGGTDGTPEFAESARLDAETEDNYENWTKKQLKAEIEQRNSELPEDEQMPVSGDKPDLIELLRNNDAESDEEDDPDDE